jgi:hypothetical protein
MSVPLIIDSAMTGIGIVLISVGLFIWIVEMKRTSQGASARASWMDVATHHAAMHLGPASLNLRTNLAAILARFSN